MNKRRLAAELISGVLAAQTVFSAMPVHAVSISADSLRPGDTVTRNPEDTIFRNDEWAGTNYTDEGSEKNTVDIFEVNRESASTNIIPYQDDASARKSVWDYNAREESSYMQMLTGEGETWQLNVVQNPAEAAKFEGEDGFTSKNFTNEAWKDVTLPCSWTMQGFDFSIYTNQTIPWQTKYGDQSSPTLAPAAPTNYNPVGMYRKSFTLKDGMADESRRVYINFQGVESAYYVYINGHEVGYSEDTFSPHKFDITDYLVEGENFLAVKVLKFSDAVWMEDQDMIYDGGIFRDVFVTSAPLAQISDYKYVTDLDETYTDATLNVDLDVRNLSASNLSGWSADVAVYDQNGNNIIASNTDAGADVSINAESETQVSISTLVRAPELWSAENPNLYALVLHLKDADGNVVETLSTQLGFREIEYTQAQVDANGNTTTTEWTPITINGKRLLCKGTDRHDSDPVYGKATPQASIEEDLKLMKQNNLNAIRTSHYSNDDYLYWLSNKWGMYIMAETNVESHCLMSDGWVGNVSGLASQIKAKFYNMIMDREKTAYERLKNNPSVVMWSLGNETARPYVLNDAGGAFKDAMAFFKREDPTRPVLFESFGSDMGGDIHGEQYPSVEGIAGWAGEGRIPYVLTEFVHSMGNSTGHISEYMDIIRPNSNMVGCFVWDWVDQSRYKSLDDLFAGWTFTDSTHGVTGDVTGVKSDLVDGLDSSKTLNAGKAMAGKVILNNNETLNSALSGADKAFTLEVNVKPNSSSANDVYLTKGDNQFALKTNKSNQLEFFVYDSTWRSLTWSLPADWAGNWQHLIVTYDQGSVNLYINGEKVGETKTLGNITINNSSNTIGIGAQDGMGRSANGQISIARIYNRALSAEEAAGQHSQTPAIGKDDASVLLWADFAEADALSEKTEIAWDYYDSKDAQVGLYPEEAKGSFLAYGGDWGDVPNDGNFCANGLVSADRDPQPELNEVKFQYQNIWFTATDAQIAKKKVTVYNENRFANLDTYDLKWEILEDGAVVTSGDIPAIDLAGLETGELSVPYVLPENMKDGAEYLLNVRAVLKNDTEWADKGHELSYAQFVLPADIEQAAPIDTSGNVTINETDDAFSVEGDGFSFAINKSTGQMVNYAFGDETLIKEGPMPYFWRCRTDNDAAEGGGSFYDNGWRHAMDEGNYTVTASSSTVDGKQVITADYTLTEAGNTSVQVVYSIDGNGAVTMNIRVDATESGMGNFISVGSSMVLPEGYENVTWYADGPDETLADRMTSARALQFSKSVSANFYPYIKVDDTGTYPETRWMRISSDNANSDVLVVAKDTVQTSALHFTAEQLEAVSHPYELSPLKDTVVGINYGSKGTGGATCGAGTRSPYLMPSSQVYEWEFTLVPVAKDDTDISDITRTYHTAEIVTVEEAEAGEVQAFIEMLENYHPLEYSHKADGEAILAAYDSLSDSQKSKLTAAQKERVENLLDEVEALNGKEAVKILDSSKNGIDLPLTENMHLNSDGTFSGYADLGHNDVLGPVFAAGKSWTVEAVFTPTTASRETVISKGDYLFTLRTEGSDLSFHIYNGSSWYQTPTSTFTAEESANFLNKEHRLTAVFDYPTKTITIYYDGVARNTRVIDASVDLPASNNDANNLCIGIDPANPDRKSNHKFASVRVFSKALTAEEAANETMTADDENTVLWLDTTNMEYAGVNLSLLRAALDKAEDITANADSYAVVPANLSTLISEGNAIIESVRNGGDDTQQSVNEKARAINSAVLEARLQPSKEKLDEIR